MPNKIKHCSLNMKELLVGMKDTSELMLDLAYSAVIYDDDDIAEEVIRLEEKMDTLEYHMKITAMQAARRIDEAHQLSGVLKAASAAENIANAAGDIANIVRLKMGIPTELKADIREAEETVTRVTIEPDSPVIGKTLGELKLETETGMGVIAIRQGSSWIYDVEKDTTILSGDILFARGHDEGLPIFTEFVTGKPFVKRDYTPTEPIEDLEKAVDIVVEMKNKSELSVGLAYSAVLFYNKDLANEVEILEKEMDQMKYELQHWVLESARHVEDVDILRGLLHLANASEFISDAAYEIADIVLRDIELHPIFMMAVRESDEVMTKINVADCSPIVNMTLGELKLETETGMHVMAIKRGSRWIYRPGSKTKIISDDILIARGSRDCETQLFEMTACHVEPGEQ
ncbi:MAG TPA: potassium channel protein [Methanosarcinales archaeon]|nr:potassium channel protein [Methanosarcinales archaeon]